MQLVKTSVVKEGSFICISQNLGKGTTHSIVSHYLVVPVDYIMAFFTLTLKNTLVGTQSKVYIAH